MALSMQGLFLLNAIGSEEADVWREISRKTTMAEVEDEQFVMDVRRFVESRFSSGTHFDEQLHAKYEEYVNGSPFQRVRALKALIAAGRVLSITGKVQAGFCFRARGLRSYAKKLYFLYGAVGDVLVYTPKLTTNHLSLPMSELGTVVSNIIARGHSQHFSVC